MGTKVDVVDISSVVSFIASCWRKKSKGGSVKSEMIGSVAKGKGEPRAISF